MIEGLIDSWIDLFILAPSGVILKPSGIVFESLGSPFGDPELPRDPRERQGGKSDGICGLGVLPGSSQEAFCLHRTLDLEVCAFYV